MTVELSDPLLSVELLDGDSVDPPFIFRMLDFNFLSFLWSEVVGECLGDGFRDLGSSISSTCLGLVLLLLPFTSLRRVSRMGNKSHAHTQAMLVQHDVILKKYFSIIT